MYNFHLYVTVHDIEHSVGGFDSVYYALKCAYAIDPDGDWTFRLAPYDIFIRLADVRFWTMYDHLIEKIHHIHLD